MIHWAAPDAVAGVAHVSMCMCSMISTSLRYPQHAQHALHKLDVAELVCTLQAGSLASNICQARPGGQPLALKLELGHREPLAGPELEAFYASRAAHAVEEDEPQPLLTPRHDLCLCFSMVWAGGPVN